MYFKNKWIVQYCIKCKCYKQKQYSGCKLRIDVEISKCKDSPVHVGQFKLMNQVKDLSKVSQVVKVITWITKQNIIMKTGKIGRV